MKKIIIANWKMNPDSLARAVSLAKNIDKSIPANIEVVIAPPLPFLATIKKTLKRAKLGAQDAFWIPKGAHTGEVSFHQLKSLRVRYVIVGHSERRALGETDEMVNKKIRSAVKEGMKVIFCIGEPLKVRRGGLAISKKFIEGQLKKGLKGVVSAKKNNSIIIAYEPIWAISTSGTGMVDTPENASKIAGLIGKFVKSHFSVSLPVLYGGSVTAKNIEGFLLQKNIGGVLVGGASLSQKEFGKILKIASK